MYEYISGVERWKKIDKSYLEKYNTFTKFVQNCQEKCVNINKGGECFETCKKPIVDIERFNVNMIKKLSLDVYDICANKINLVDLSTDINKIKTCCDNLYRENEIIVKKETLDRMDDIIKFLNI